MTKLPAPRLQISWEKEDENNYNATYELVIHEGEKCKLDIRANDHETDRPTAGVVKVELGKTSVGGGGGIVSEDGKIRTPFRDGVHIMRDSIVLGLPMFVVYGEMAHPIEMDEDTRANIEKNFLKS